MVTHASDASHVPPPGDDLADKIAEKVNANLLQDAYGLLKSGTNNVFSGSDADGDGVVDINRNRNTDVPMITSERNEYMQRLSQELQQKCPGALEKLSASWMNDYYHKEILDKNGKPTREFSVDEVTAEAQRGSGIDKVMANASLKDLKNVAAFTGKPDVIDQIDIYKNLARVAAEPRDAFAKRVMDNVACLAETNLGQAYATLKSELGKRHSYETPSEIGADEKALVDALKANPKLEAQLAMVWLQKGSTDMTDPYKGGVTLEKLKNHSNEDYVDALLNKFVIDNFGVIGSSSLQNSRDDVITPDEIPNYIRRVKNK